MLTQLRSVMAVAAVSLLVAAALHAGLVIPGPFDQAAMFEAGIAVVLVIALALTFLVPGSARWIGLASLTVALAGACIGLFLALRGLAPNTVADIVYHFALVALLLVGLVVAWRTEPDRQSERA